MHRLPLRLKGASLEVCGREKVAGHCSDTPSLLQMFIPLTGEICCRSQNLGIWLGNMEVR
ncbi:hypothetical protein ANCDUO_25807 [Ancylostoma duodenale]|uniref:Uncharacterized protein n=1 Tax=Ancylostoma duodenale TaxID=51022 RepID=A0A0C2F6L8_9BILA|nr:hypothetical protein ANCDUO_25807 [Ancylostoma duodenale]